MSGSSEILAAIRDLQTHFEGQFHATNKAIQELHKSTDSLFDALQAGPLPARSGSQQHSRWGANNDISPFLPTAPFQPPGSAAPPPFLSFDITSAAASTSIAAVPPPFLSSDDTTTLFQTTDDADGKASLGSGISGLPLASTVLDSTPLCLFSGSLLPVELFGTAPSPAPEPAPEVTPPPDIHLRPLPPPSPPTTPSAYPSPTKTAMFPPPTTTSPKLSNLIVLAHSTEVGRILGIILWPSPSDMEAQSNPFNKYQDVATVASRRGVIFSLYALEEVYKDILESPP